MPKLTGPLCSLGAFGSLGPITIRQTAHGHVATKRPRPSGAPSDVQLQLRAQWHDAATAWSELSNEDRADWQASAASWALPPFALFAREWSLQQSTIIKPPFIPSTRWQE